MFGYVRKDVERSLRRRTGNAGYLPHAGQHAFSPLRVLRKHLRYRIHGTSERGDGGLLRKRIRVRNGLALGSGPSANPARQPVIEKVFEREPATITCGFASAADAIEYGFTPP